MADVREDWDRTARTVGGTAPDISDEEILAIGMSVCEHMVANPLDRSTNYGMAGFSQVAAIVSDALGIPYDPALQDAGFESGFDARIVVPFGDVLEKGALCPDVWGFNVYVFSSPWSVRASDEGA